jgi:anti-sigma factor RsiW
VLPVPVDDCKSFIACLSDYFDGEIDEQVKFEFEQHLRFCSDARTMVHTFQRTIVLHRLDSGMSLPEGLHERLAEAIKRCFDSDS